MMGFIELHCNGRKVYIGVNFLNANPPMSIQDDETRGSTLTLIAGGVVRSYELDETAEEVAQKINDKLLPPG